MGNAITKIASGAPKENPSRMARIVEIIKAMRPIKKLQNPKEATPSTSLVFPSSKRMRSLRVSKRSQTISWAI